MRVGQGVRGAGPQAGAAPPGCGRHQGGRRGRLGARAGCGAAERGGARGRSGAPGGTAGRVGGAQLQCVVEAATLLQADGSGGLELPTPWGSSKSKASGGPARGAVGSGVQQSCEYRQLMKRGSWANGVAWVGPLTSSQSFFLDPVEILSAWELLETQPGTAGPNSGTKGLIGGWEDPFFPLPPDVGGQGPQGGPQEADPESLGSSRRDRGFFTFTSPFSTLATAFRCSPRHTRKAPPGAEDTTTGNPTCWDKVDPR